MSLSLVPKLLYVGDVPVEASYHGSALLFRLLEEYPEDRLQVVEVPPWLSSAERRLPGVTYSTTEIGISRLLQSRFARVYGSWLLRSNRMVGALSAIALKSKPEAILTVTHGYSWLIAAEFAMQHNLPLHLILHDDWLSSVPMLSISRRRAENLFRRYYRAASSRLCVSPAMIESYREKYGIGGTLLYPSQARTAKALPLDRLRNSGKAKAFAYAGTLANLGYARAISSLSEVLEKCGGKLIIYGPINEDHAAALGLRRSNITLRGFLSSGDLINELREVADVLFLPMSFEPADRTQMQLCFPSKLTDYTSIGVPILIYGPPYCSAIRWARDNPGVAETAERDGADALRPAVEKLINDSHYRSGLAEGAARAGGEFFSYENAKRIFYGALCQNGREIQG